MWTRGEGVQNPCEPLLWMVPQRETHGGVHGGRGVRVVVADPVVLADVLRLVVARVRVPLADLVSVVHLDAHRVPVLVHVGP